MSDAKERVIAAMSGGVDSAVAAGLLVESGYDVVGITMKMYAPSRPAHAKSCCGIDDFDDARAQRRRSGHPALRSRLRGRRFGATSSSDSQTNTRAGRTPNPCVSCNNFVKLGTLAQYADRLGARYVATGHYARLEHRDDGPHLFRNDARERSSLRARTADAGATRTALAAARRARQGGDARARAAVGLPVHDKTESQDICFVEGGDCRSVLERVHPEINAPGDVVATSGAKSARMPASRTTVGQRAASGRATTARATLPGSTPRRTRSSSDAKTSCSAAS